MGAVRKCEWCEGQGNASGVRVNVAERESDAVAKYILPCALYVVSSKRGPF